jgi:hypothetical protein
MNFPLEIRNIIYECILTEPNTILSEPADELNTPRFSTASSKNRNVQDLNIFRANKQIFAEARKIFFSCNVFEINIIEEGSRLCYNFVPTEWDYAIKALRHIKVYVQTEQRRNIVVPRAIAKLK